jgi:radical SAM protein with 4Fe4S-binding SPASM domain
MDLDSYDRVDANLFRDGLSRSAAEALFRTYVRNINLELFDHCNRQCPYCPVALVDRRSAIKHMPADRVTALIGELQRLDYDKSICLNLFNEPLASERTFEVIAEIKAALPNVRVWFNTNGDYLNRKIVAFLADLGVARIVVTLHFQQGETYDDLVQLTRVSQLSARTGLNFTFTKFKPGKDLKAKARKKGLQIDLKSVNYLEHGVNRGDLLEDLTPTATRTTPCDRPFHEVSIGWNGAVYPCCQFFPDSAAHDAFIAGHIGDSPLADIYASKLMASFRRDTFGYGEKRSPCDTCLDRDRCRGEDDRAERMKWQEAVANIAVSKPADAAV